MSYNLIGALRLGIFDNPVLEAMDSRPLARSGSGGTRRGRKNTKYEAWLNMVTVPAYKPDSASQGRRTLACALGSVLSLRRVPGVLPQPQPL